MIYLYIYYNYFEVARAYEPSILDRPYRPVDLPSFHNPWRIHGAAIYGNMDPISITPLC